MREIIDKLSLQGTKNNVAQVQEMSNSISPLRVICFCLLLTPPHLGFPVSFDLLLTLI